MLDIIIIEKNIDLVCEIELLLISFNMNMIHLKKHKNMMTSFFTNKIIIINALYLPLYESLLEYSIVIVYGLKPMQQLQNNFIYISYDSILTTLQKVFTYLQNPKLHAATKSIYNITITQYLLKKLQNNDNSPLDQPHENKVFNLNVKNKNMIYIENFLSSLIDIKWINEIIKSRLLDLLTKIIILQQNIIVNISNISMTLVNNIYYITINYINNNTALYAITNKIKQKKKQS